MQVLRVSDKVSGSSRQSIKGPPVIVSTPSGAIGGTAGEISTVPCQTPRAHRGLIRMQDPALCALQGLVHICKHVALWHVCIHPVGCGIWVLNKLKLATENGKLNQWMRETHSLDRPIWATLGPFLNPFNPEFDL